MLKQNKNNIKYQLDTKYSKQNVPQKQLKKQNSKLSAKNKQLR